MQGMSNRNRVQPGVREGGQFAPNRRSEPVNSLTPTTGTDGHGVPAAEWSPFRHAPRSVDQLWPTEQTGFDSSKYDIPDEDRDRIAQEFGLDCELQSVELEGRLDCEDRQCLDVTFSTSNAGGHRSIEFPGDPLAAAALFTARCAPHPDPVEVLEAADGRAVLAWNERGSRQLVSTPEGLTKHGAVLASRSAAIDYQPALAWSHGETGWDEQEKRVRHASALAVAGQRLRDAEASIPVRVEVGEKSLDRHVRRLTGAGLRVDVSPREGGWNSVMVTTDLADVGNQEGGEAALRLHPRLMDWLDPHQGALEFELAQWDRRPGAAEVDAMATEKAASLNRRTPWEGMNEEQSRARRAVMLTVEDYRNAINAVCDAFEAPRS